LGGGSGTRAGRSLISEKKERAGAVLCGSRLGLEGNKMKKKKGRGSSRRRSCLEKGGKNALGGSEKLCKKGPKMTYLQREVFPVV